MKKLLFVVVLAACGGGDTKVVALDSGGENDLCSYLLGHQPAKRTIDCGGGMMVTVGGASTETQAQCVASIEKTKTDHPSCTATVSETENCFDAQNSQSDAWYCSQLTPNPQAEPSECAAIINASCSGSSTPQLSTLTSPALSVETER